MAAGCGAADSADTERAPLPPMEQSGKPGQPAAAAKSQAAVDGDCPLELPGARLASEVTADGVALVFTSDGGDPAELRARVQRMASRHAQGDPAIPSRAKVEEIAGGARLIFTPVDASQVGMLREHIRVHGKEMASSGCKAPAPARVVSPPASENPTPPPPADPSPTPKPDEPIMPDRPVTPDHPITPPTPPPPGMPLGE